MTTTFLTDRTRLWAQRAAVHYLTKYASSSQNLREKIYQKASRKYEGIDESEAEALADAAVDFCSKNGFLNDNAYASSQAKGRASRGTSKRKIAMQLAEKGISEEDAAEALEAVDDLTSAILYAKKRRLGPWRSKELDLKRKQKEAASLARQGFSGSLSFKVIALDLEEAETILLDHKATSTWRHD